MERDGLVGKLNSDIGGEDWTRSEKGKRFDDW